MQERADLLEIFPIPSKTEQETACARCGVSFYPDCTAYVAKEGGKFLAIAQFTVKEREGFLKSLGCAKELEDDEILLLLGRAVLNFMDLCGVHTAVCAEGATTKRAIDAIGFSRDAEGVLHANMTRMFGERSDKR